MDPEIKGKRAAKYIQGFRKELLSLAHSCGYEHPGQFTGQDIEISMGMNRYQTLEGLLGYKRDEVKFTKLQDYTVFPKRQA